MLVVAGPAAAQRRTVPTRPTSSEVAAAPNGLGRAYVSDGSIGWFSSAFDMAFAPEGTRA